MSRYETPAYEVLVKDGPIEVRRYQPFWLMRYENEADRNADQGFQTLFRYIQSDNREQEKMAMTVPVLRQGDQVQTLSFIVPSSHEEKIPHPNDQRLSARLVEGGLFGAITFHGSWREMRLEKYREKLEEWLNIMGYDRSEETYTAFYNPPFVPAPLRKNEILIRIE
jgi:hypothetical protein